jgi:DNA-binding IclR family transcriptional regulator
MRQDRTSTESPSALAKGHRRILNLGLDILEYLTKCQQPLTLATISAHLQVPSAAVSRALSVLEARRYLTRNGEEQSYQVTGKLLALHPKRPLSLSLLARARPIMQELNKQTSLSCNLAIVSDNELKVIAQPDSPAGFSITLPIGFAYDIPDSAPGLAYLAFSGASDPSAWPDQASVIGASEWSMLRSAVQKAADMGYAQMANAIMPDVTDISCPVYQYGDFVAILTIPFIETRSSAGIGWTTAALLMAAGLLSQALQDDCLVA